MRNTIDFVLKIALVLLMGILVIDVVWQVFSRYILQDPSVITGELARFLLIWVSFLGATYMSGQNSHIAIEVLQQKLDHSQKFKVNLLIKIIIILFVLSVFVIGGGYLVYTTYTYTQITPTLQIPMAFVYLIGPISGLIITYYKLSDIRYMIKTGSADIEVPESNTSN